MKLKQGGVQLILISIGLLLFVLTYLFYPNIKNKNKLSKDQRIVEDIEKITGQTQSTAFEKLEYKGLYDFNKPFKVKSEKAYIFNEEPDIVYMDQMQVILNLSDERVVIITSDKGRYNKRTYDCFFEQNVKATDENTKIYADNLDLLATINSVEIYNNVIINYPTANLLADKVNYDFETKYFKVSMFSNKTVKMKVVE